ncbi:hypothetical protein CVT26_004396 [Gymnopilus dilepis]|uniref:Uncharacterized protein n=1 Tax=Gymnopilus dilepis TaxID=231916 RepID=A0A409WYD1_9AGAR|nr:hypothetical protein CVT26_004396 [Gymnopilus dilepis]
MVQARRRVSYIIPSPSDSPSFAAGSQPGYSVPPPRLLLPPLGVPRHGVPGPLLIPHPSNSASSSPWSASSSPTYTSSGQDGAAEPYGQQHPQAHHPRHRLGVACLALDASTLLVGKDSPEGILYTGGRDGIFMAWDLGVPMQRRKGRSATDSSAGGADARTATGSGAASPETAGSGSSAGSSRNASSDDLSPHQRRRRKRTINRWEVLTGWEDDALDSEGEEAEGGAHQQGGSDGDVLGDVVSSATLRKKKRLKMGQEEEEIPYEWRWETDLGKFQAGTRTKFRQCSQAHTDWVNDIVLCNYNQTLVSASSDGTVKAWSPHAATPADPVKIGMHADYILTLLGHQFKLTYPPSQPRTTLGCLRLIRPHNQALGPNPLVPLRSTFLKLKLLLLFSHQLSPTKTPHNPLPPRPLRLVPQVVHLRPARGPLGTAHRERRPGEGGAAVGPAQREEDGEDGGAYGYGAVCGGE